MKKLAVVLLVVGCGQLPDATEEDPSSQAEALTGGPITRHFSANAGTGTLVTSTMYRFTSTVTSAPDQEFQVTFVNGASSTSCSATTATVSVSSAQFSQISTWASSNTPFGIDVPCSTDTGTGAIVGTPQPFQEVIVASATTPNGSATISWPAAPGASSYTVYRNNLVVGQNVTRTTFVDTPGACIASYYRVISNLGQRSNDLGVLVPPPAPVLSNTVLVGSQGTTLSYSNTFAIASYGLLRSTSASGPFTDLNAPIHGTTLVDERWALGVPYFYEAQASCAVGGLDMAASASNHVQATNNNPPIAGSLYIPQANALWRADASNHFIRLGGASDWRNTTSCAPGPSGGDQVFIISSNRLWGFDVVTNVATQYGGNNDWAGATQMTTDGRHLYVAEGGALWLVDPLASPTFSRIGVDSWPAATTTGLTQLGSSLYVISNATLFKVTLATGRATQLGRTNDWTGVTRMTNDGTLLYIMEDDQLFRVSPTDGSWFPAGLPIGGAATALTTVGNMIYYVKGDVLHSFNPSNTIDIEIGAGWINASCIAGVQSIVAK